MEIQKEEAIIPSEHEKLSYKFILDSVKKRVPVELETDTEELVEEEFFLEAEEQFPIEELSLETSPDIEDLKLPSDKNYFRIKEASEIIGVEAHVLRYWETEFPQIRPMKAASGKRAYRKKDVQLFHKIKYLLHVEKFSIKGAKQKLTESKNLTCSSTIPSLDYSNQLKKISSELKELIILLRQDPGGF